MLTVNVNLEDRLVNMLVGMVMDFKVVNNKVKQDFAKFEDETAGRIAMHDNRLTLENHWLPIEIFKLHLVLKK